MVTNGETIEVGPESNDFPSVDVSIPSVNESLHQDQLLARVESEQLLKDRYSYQTKATRCKLQERKDSPAETDGDDSLTAGKHLGDIAQLESEFDSLSLHKEDAPKVENATMKYPGVSRDQARTSKKNSPRGFNNQPDIFHQQSDGHTRNKKKPKDCQFLTNGRIKKIERDPSMPILNLLPRPQPTTAYLKQASKVSTKLELVRPLLVIVDLNGCLLDRGKNKGGIGHHRPYLKEFLEYSLDYHHVMVWSSATPVNVRSMSEHAFAGLKKQPIMVWDRRSLRLTKEQARQKVQVYKQLDWIWDDKEISQFHPYALSGGSWNQTNTILIDDSIEKAAAQPHNQLLVPEYKKENEKQERETKVLLRAVEYLKEAAYYEDVSSFIFNVPFQKWMKTRSIPSEASVTGGDADINQV